MKYSNNQRVSDELQTYLFDLNEGLGTAYERYVLNRFVEKLVKRLKINSVLELPANGVMGVPGIKSLAFAKMGCDVTLVNPSQKAIDEMKKLWNALGLEANFVVSDYEKTRLKPDSYDLVWNFCVFEHFDNPQNVLAEMARLSKKFVLVEIQNVFNIGFPIHRAYHKIKHEGWDHGDVKKMKHGEVSKMMRDCGLNIREVDATDMPPWPDINMKLGEASCETMDFANYGKEFEKLRPKAKPKEVNDIVESWKKLDTTKRLPLSMRLLELWYYLERLTPRQFRIFISHHPYVIGEK